MMTHSTEIRPKRIPWKSIGILFSAFSVIVLLYVFFGVNYYYLKIFSAQSNTEHQLLQTQKNISAVEQQVQELTTLIKTQDQAINELRQIQSNASPDKRRILEAHFLVKLANDKLRFENNIPQAILLLQTADEEIRSMNDEKLLLIRRALAADITNLQSIPAVDTVGIYAKLSALNDAIGQLPLPNKAAEPAVAPPTNEKMSGWRRSLNQTWDALRQIIVIRYYPENKPPLIMPEQKDFLYQNLHAAVEKAMWGLLHQKPEIYYAALTQTEQWIKLYFAPSPLTETVLNQIAVLKQINVRPEAIKPLESLGMFSSQ